MSRAPPIRVTARLDRHAFGEVRRTMELSHFKWDVQVGDVTAIAPFALVVPEAAWRELAHAAERLTRETFAIEDELWQRPELHGDLAMPPALRNAVARGSPSPAAVRIMRFDFHPTRDGWRLSEVNTDVPGGFTESTWLPRLFRPHLPAARPAGDPTEAFLDAVARRVGPTACVALSCAPGHMEDHQVISHLAARFRERSASAHLVAPGQLRWIDRAAHIEHEKRVRRVDAIVRFYQSEWLAALPPATGWRYLFADGLTLVANPGIAALSESKRLPLSWSRLRTATDAWRTYLPETRDPREVGWPLANDWVLKSAYSNTGDSVTMRSTMSRFEWHARTLRARARPSGWIAQRRFDTIAIESEGERFYPCIGVYTVDGVAAGAYARVATRPVIDGTARDVAFFVEDPSS